MFRWMPAQQLEKVPVGCSLRHGFVVANCPRGTPIGSESYAAGDYVASWATVSEAIAAALALGYNPQIVQPVVCLMPESL